MLRQNFWFFFHSFLTRLFLIGVKGVFLFFYFQFLGAFTLKTYVFFIMKIIDCLFKRVSYEHNNQLRPSSAPSAPRRAPAPATGSRRRALIVSQTTLGIRVPTHAPRHLGSCALATVRAAPGCRAPVNVHATHFGATPQDGWGPRALLRVQRRPQTVVCVVATAYVSSMERARVKAARSWI